MKGLFSALGFFTILPIPAKYASLPVSDTLKWFPAAGLILGCLWAGLDFLIGLFFSGYLRAFLDVLALVVLTGGLHLDGLADTADGLLSHRSREDKLRIMKDSRIGSWGVLALIAILGLKTLSVGELVQKDGIYLYLALIPVYGRLSMFAGSRLMPYGRGEEGLGYGLYGDGRHLDWLAAFSAAALLSLVLGWPDFLIVNACFLVALSAMIGWYRRSIGAVTGDMLGAMGEVVETFLLLSLAALQAFIRCQRKMTTDKTRNRKAIILAAYGTTRPEALIPLVRLKEKISSVFPGVPIELAFTSRFVLKKWRERREDKTWPGAHPDIPAEIYRVKSPLAAMAALRDEGKDILAVQSLHIYAGEEYYNLKSMIEALSSIRTVNPEQGPFLKILLGRPALGEPGSNQKFKDDALKAAEALGSLAETARKNRSALLLVGHGSRLISSQPYLKLEKTMNRIYPDIKTLVGLIQGNPSLELILSTLNPNKTARITLAPLLLVMGEHAKMDILGNRPGSWKTELLTAGFQVECLVKALGELEAWNDIYLRHLRQAVGSDY